MRKIGKYVVRGLLGRGGMGRIYKVEHPVIGKISALKRLDPKSILVELMGWKALQAAFLKEATALAGLRHPNVVEILDFDESGDTPFYLMEYYANNLGVMVGESPRIENPSRRLPPERVLHYAGQVLEGLACLHDAGIVHLDIKPFNLLITDYDTVKICDFGLSKVRGEGFSGLPSLKVGTAGYASPEQAAAPDSVTVTADLYAVGVTLHRMLTGFLPENDTPPPSKICAELDPPWDDFIRRATAQDPIRRFATAREMLSTLDDLHRLWKEKKERTCRLPQRRQPKPRRTDPVPDAPPRIRCVKVAPRQAREFFGLDDLWRPASYSRERFRTAGDGTVTAAGRVWQQSGSEFSMTWDQAWDYVGRLNDAGFAGSTRWRLPTIDELKTLLTAPPQNRDYCIEPIFDRRQLRLWSCDRRSFVAAWYVSIDLGFVAWQDFSARYHVRAVHSE